MNLRAVVVLAGVFTLGILANSQSPLPASAQAPGFGGDPEDAYLSPSRYTNVYFGFSFELPEVAGLKPIPQPASLDRRIQLLELSGVPHPHSAITISAYEYKNKNYTDAKALLRKELDQELFTGLEQLKGISKTTCGGTQFYYFEARKGVDQHVELATEMNGYVLDVDLRAKDVQLLHDLLAAFQHAEFFSSQEAAKHAGTNALAYEGPAISARRLREVRESLPAEHMDAGSIDGNIYRNAQIGLMYEFPRGWNLEPQGAIEPSVERYREKVLGEPLLGSRERAMVKACRRTLFSVWRTKPDSAGEVSYEDFGEVTLTAMPVSCFPNIRFPHDAKDAVEVRQFVAGLTFTQPLQRDMTEARTFEANGTAFVVTHGTIAYKEEGDALSRRVSVSMAMTQQRGYLLIWLYAAPHDAELRELMASSANFDKDEIPKTAQTPVIANAPATAAQLDTKSDVSTTPSPQPQPAEAAPDAQADFHPSLLRAGETPQANSGGQQAPEKRPN